MDNKKFIEGWRKIILGTPKTERYEIVTCNECGGSGFDKPGTGYDAVCDNCGGQGEHPI